MPWFWKLDLESMAWEPCWKELKEDRHHIPWSRSFHEGGPRPDDGMVGPEIPEPGPPRLIGELPEGAYPEGYYELKFVDKKERDD